ncbi:MAG: hypothetical protein SPI77_04825 [Corynebacterium sp.]|nr:hypothetical protein [Corynebacterium sp.]
MAITDDIDEFFATLTSYATGSYLRDDERTWWDAPFDVAVLPQLRAIVDEFVAVMQAIEPNEEAVHAAVTRFEEEITAFNAENGYAVIEPEEAADLRLIVKKVLRLAHVDGAYINSLEFLEE